jgi:DNA-binding LytR/AlgR family response regulator
MDLKALGYEVSASVRNSDEVFEALKREIPDILLLDIKMEKSNSPLDGIEVAQKINESYDLPIILMTGMDNPKILERTKGLSNINYLHKPFSANELDIQISLAAKNFIEKTPNKQVQIFIDRFLIRDKGEKICIRINNIYYIKTDGGCIEIYLKNKTRYVLSLTLSRFFEQFQHPNLVRIHNSHAINIRYLDKIIGNQVLIGGEILNIGQIYRGVLKDYFIMIKG